MASSDRNFFCKLKEFKRIAMRADKTDQSFNAIIQLAAAVINSQQSRHPFRSRPFDQTILRPFSIPSPSFRAG